MRNALLHIGFLVALWLGVIVCKPAIERQFSSLAIGQANKTLVQASNPLYPALADVAKSYGVDVSFMKNPVRTRSNQLYDSELFTKLPHSYDVLVFGDSSLVWSFSPQVMAQAIHKRVAFFGAESAYPNQPFMTLAEQLSNTYLKSDGIALFLFAEWTWGARAEWPQPVREMDELVRAAQTPQFRLPFERAVNSILRLPRLNLYAELVEPHVAPEHYRESHALMYGRGCNFYSWGQGSNAFLLSCDASSGVANAKSAKMVNVAVAIVPSCDDHPPNAAIAENLRALVRANIRHKAVAIPFSEKQLDPSFYCQAEELKYNVRVINLPRVAVEKYGVQVLQFESVTHLANTSSIPASVILARELDIH